MLFTDTLFFFLTNLTNNNFLAERNKRNEIIYEEPEISGEEKIALNGKPKLGIISKIEIIIRESDEFKVSLIHFSLLNSFLF